MADLFIEDIIADAQRRVKKESDSDKEEFSNHLKESNDDWIDKVLSFGKDDLVHTPPEMSELTRSKADLKRRITHGDFRERFSDNQNQTVEQPRQDWFEKVVSDTLRTYTECLSMVE